MAEKLFVKIDTEDKETSALFGCRAVLTHCELKPHEQRRVLMYLLERATQEASAQAYSELTDRAGSLGGGIAAGQMIGGCLSNGRGLA